MEDHITGWIGIDTGISGAIGFINPKGHALVFDPPTIKVPVAGKQRSQMLEGRAAGLIREIMALDPETRWRAALEWAQAMPLIHAPKGEKPCPECGRVGDPEALARQGAVSAFSYGTNYGAWRGILGTLEIPFIEVRPQLWKKVMLAGFAEKNKDAARAVASKLFPGVDLGRRKDQGRAEALIIAEFGRRTARIE